MITIEIDGAVSERFPEASIAVVVAHGVRGADSWEESERELARLEHMVEDGLWAPPTEADQSIAAWHVLYRRFGTNPRRARPSVEALCRRLARSGKLPRINGAVDAYNAVSVRHVVAAGAFNLDSVVGNVSIRLAREGDVFVPLGEPSVEEHPPAGEVVYADQVSVLTRHWNHRDAERTKVTPQSRHVVFVLESAQAALGQDALVRASEMLTGLLETHSARVNVQILTANGKTAVTLDSDR